MKYKLKRVLIAVTALAALGAGGAAIAGATGGDDDATDKPIKGSALDRASAVALDHTGGGRVTATEVGDEEGYYEIEVRLPDGSQTDVHLDRQFKVIGSVADGDGAGGEDGPNDD
jgi:uncharacterized membrane protein YkoI